MTWLLFDISSPRLRARVEANSFEEAAQKMGCRPGKNNMVWPPDNISEYSGQAFELVPFDTWYKNIREIKEPLQLGYLLRKYGDH